MRSWSARPRTCAWAAPILKFYLDREKGDYTKALARYNGSVGRRNYADLVPVRLGQSLALPLSVQR